MSNIVFRPFDKQREFLKSNARIRGAFAGRRSGKTEIGAIASIMLQEQQKNIQNQGVDPFLGVIIGPTLEMTKRLSWKKFMTYARPFIKTHTKSPLHIEWHDGSEVIGISADRPERLEGVKANWIWIDEVLQVKEQLFLECKARTADTQGSIICTGSLGTNIVNPASTWVYKYFKENPDKNTEAFEWYTLQNPYFPRDEIENLRETLDPMTFRQMFEIDWDTTPKHAVYSEYGDNNHTHNYTWNPALETYIGIDWGWAHPMAVLFVQYDPVRDIVYVFDEIIESKVKVFDGELFNKIQSKINARGIKRVDDWVCDIAGNQEREQVGRSNVAWFKDKGINFKMRRTAINYGIPIIRSYIKDGMARSRLFVDIDNCKKFDDGMKRYTYQEKDGIVLNENPIKKDDDAVDCFRYIAVNKLDPNIRGRKTRSIQL